MTINTLLSEQEIHDLENLIDKRGICGVLTAIGVIAALKSEHIAHHWQDASTAKKWDKVATALAYARDRSWGL